MGTTAKGRESQKRKIDTQRCVWPAERGGCTRRALPTSDHCKEHLNLKKLYDQAAKTGAKVVENKDGSHSVVGGSTPRKKRGRNVREIGELKSAISKAGDDALKRFSGQLGLAHTLALELDNGDTTHANVYKGVLQDIHTRMDRIYGTQNLDIITRMEMMIDENAKKRQAKGWG